MTVYKTIMKLTAVALGITFLMAYCQPICGRSVKDLTDQSGPMVNQELPDPVVEITGRQSFPEDDYYDEEEDEEEEDELQQALNEDNTVAGHSAGGAGEDGAAAFEEEEEDDNGDEDEDEDEEEDDETEERFMENKMFLKAIYNML